MIKGLHKTQEAATDTVVATGETQEQNSTPLLL